MNKTFWAGKSVFLTGHTGFKGSWLSIWLHHLGARVHGFSLPPHTRPSLFAEAAIEKVLASHQVGDIRDFTELSDAIRNCNPDIVIHMAAQPLVRQSYVDPIETYEVNVLGTIKLLQALRYAPSVRSTVIVTSDKCYENVERASGYSENEPMGGYDPYSSSKGCAELVISAMRRSFFSDTENHIASARAGNVIGGGDWASDRLIPDFVRAIARNERVLIRNPRAIRPWQHVLEPLAGYLALAEMLYTGGAPYASGWNFGPHEGDAQNVAYVADSLVNLWGERAQWELDGDTHPHEATYLKLNIEKAISQLGWQPRLSLDESLKLTCDWYKGFYAQKDSYELTLNQIISYESEKLCLQRES